ELLPRCAALVHHGGIGTCSQALAAGIPHLVTPMAHDQPDNARRLQKLGVARSLPVKRFKPESAARLLRELLESRAVAAACAHVRDRMRHENGIAQSCDWIEALARLPRLKCAPVTPAPPPESFPSPTPAQSASPSPPPPALR